MTLYRNRFDIIASILETAKAQRVRHTDILKTASPPILPIMPLVDGFYRYSVTFENTQSIESTGHYSLVNKSFHAMI